jgi:aryl-alcohol dehydrogenase-like predicted oxidoreductase
MVWECFSQMATQKGTTHFASKFPHLSFGEIPALKSKVSRIGIGGFRFSDSLFVRRMIENGFNLLDSSSHFKAGNSEILMGKAIKSLDRREEIVLSTKAGFMLNPMSKKYPNMIQVKQQHYHCISPPFLQDEITTSLQRIGVDSIDIFMLNNPERILSGGVSEGALFEMIHQAFHHLDLEVARGRIASYGVASNSIHLPSAMDHISMQKILDLNPKHLSAIQYPFNLYEKDAIEEGLDGSPSLAEICSANKIFQMTQRPFVSITPKGVRKLVTTDLEMSEMEINQLATSQFEVLTEMEVDLGMMLGSDEVELSLISKFVVAQIIAQNLSRLVENSMAAELYFKRDIIPSLEKDILELEEYAKSLEDSTIPTFLQSWIPRYKKEAIKLLDSVKQVALWHLNRSNMELNEILGLRAHRDTSLAVNALSVCLSSTASFPSSVLVGMDQEQHLRDALEAIQKPVISTENLQDIFTNPILEE